jgi:DNA-directed RNA polymerase beta' subunit
MLVGSGVKVDKSGNKISIGALTDKHVAELSSGALKEALFVRAKDLRPEEGGLFDPVLTGGSNGSKWTHIDLHEPIVNPIFADPARRLLGMTGPQFKTAIADKGAGWIRDQLKEINVDTKIKSLKDDLGRLRGSALDSAVKQIKYLDALKQQGLEPHEAYILSKIPVVPPSARPIVPSPRGDLLINDANYLYRDLMLANDKLKVAKEDLGTQDFISKARTHLHDATGALFGLQDPVSPQNASRGVKGFLSMIAGTSSPKYGYFQGKLIKRQLDLSGRSTIVPDVNLGMEEIGLPEDMLWTMYSQFIIGRLVRRGYDATQAKKMVEDRAPAAREELHRETKERPVIYNRAPTLHRGNIIAAYPKMVDGQTIRVPATWAEPLMNADFDGDTMQIHTPITKAGIEDAKRMTIPNQLFADKVKGKLWVTPQMEAVIGAYKASTAPMTDKKNTHFKNHADAMASYRRGDTAIGDSVTVDE